MLCPAHRTFAGAARWLAGARPTSAATLCWPCLALCFQRIGMPRPPGKVGARGGVHVQACRRLHRMRHTGVSRLHGGLHRAPLARATCRVQALLEARWRMDSHDGGATGMLWKLRAGASTLTWASRYIAHAMMETMLRSAQLLSGFLSLLSFFTVAKRPRPSSVILVLRGTRPWLWSRIIRNILTICRLAPYEPRLCKAGAAAPRECGRAHLDLTICTTSSSSQTCAKPHRCGMCLPDPHTSAYLKVLSRCVLIPVRNGNISRWREAGSTPRRAGEPNGALRYGRGARRAGAPALKHPL